MSTAGGRRHAVWRNIIAFAPATLSGLALNVLATGLFASGPLRYISFTVAALLVVALIVAVLVRPAGRQPGVPAQPTELAVAAGQAEQRLVALGSDGGGMAAAEWFEREEPALRRLVAQHATDPSAADDVAHICDALDAWYVRERRAADLLDLADRLAAVADRAGRRDLKELAMVRAATAHRLAGRTEVARRELDRAGEATRGPAAAALRTRQRVERALGNLARADRCEPGSDFDDHVADARDRLEDAAATLPRADVAGDMAIQLNRGVVALYRQDGERARDLLTLIASRAQAAKDVSTQAHAEELLGVTAWMLDHPHEAAVRWQAAARMYGDIDEREGRARCLQHLGSAAHVSAVVSRLLRRDGEDGRPPALRLLEDSAELRGGSRGHPVLEHYLAAASGDEPPARTGSTDRQPSTQAGLLRQARLAVTRQFRRLRRRRDPQPGERPRPR